MSRRSSAGSLWLVAQFPAPLRGAAYDAASNPVQYTFPAHAPDTVAEAVGAAGSAV
jgi:hypothetical protein